MTKALADAQRVRILMLLQGGERCVCQIVEVLALAPSTISKHLSILDAAGMVESRKEGRWAYYRLPGREAAPAVRGGLRWLQAALGADEVVRRDRAALRRVVSCDPGQVSRGQRIRARGADGRKVSAG